MNLIDTNAINYMLKSGKPYEGLFFLAPEIVDEVDLTLTHLNKSLPENILDITESNFFNEVIYLKYFQKMLNAHSQFSFFNMTGIGDISILATIHMLLATYSTDEGRVITIYTYDNPLRKKVEKEFKGLNVALKAYNDIQ